MQIESNEDHTIGLSEIYVGVSLKATLVKLFVAERDGTFELTVSSTKETKRYIIDGADIKLVPSKDKYKREGVNDESDRYSCRESL